MQSNSPISNMHILTFSRCRDVTSL